MSQSRSISRSVSGGTISIDASYAQELLQFWIQKYEQAKGELDQIKVRVLRCNSEDCRYIPLTIAIRRPPFLLPCRPERALTTRARVYPAPPRRSESQTTGFPTPELIHSPF